MAFEQLRITKKLEEFWRSLNEALAKNGGNMDYVQFFAQLNDYPCWKTKTGYSKYWYQLRDMFCKEEYEARFENKPQKGKKMQENQSSLFPFDEENIPSGESVALSTSIHNERLKVGEQSKYLYNDDNAWSIIANVVPSNVAERLQKDLKWFQSEIRKQKSKRYKYYQSIDETDNNTVIEKFCHLKEKEKNGKPQAPYFTTELRQKVKDLLTQYYAN